MSTGLVRRGPSVLSSAAPAPPAGPHGTALEPAAPPVQPVQLRLQEQEGPAAAHADPHQREALRVPALRAAVRLGEACGGCRACGGGGAPLSLHPPPSASTATGTSSSTSSGSTALTGGRRRHPLHVLQPGPPPRPSSSTVMTRRWPHCTVSRTPGWTQGWSRAMSGFPESVPLLSAQLPSSPVTGSWVRSGSNRHWARNTSSWPRNRQ